MTTTHIFHKKFTIGETYTTRSACDHDCIFSFKVLSRTDKTVTFEYLGKSTTRRVRVDGDGVESCHPLGVYSMAPVLNAADDLAPAPEDAAPAEAAPADKVQVGVVDLTPTWEEVVAICIAVLERSDNEQAKATAREELFRAGRLADAYVASQNVHKAVLGLSGTHYAT